MVLELSKYIPGKGKGGGKEADVVELSDTETSQEVMEVQRRQKALDGLGIVAGAIPRTPFGVQRLRRNNGSSPYGRKQDQQEQQKKDEKEKDPTENMTVEQLLIQSAQMEKNRHGAIEDYVAKQEGCGDFDPGGVVLHSQEHGGEWTVVSRRRHDWKSDPFNRILNACYIFLFDIVIFLSVVVYMIISHSDKRRTLIKIGGHSFFCRERRKRGPHRVSYGRVFFFAVLLFQPHPSVSGYVIDSDAFGRGR